MTLRRKTAADDRENPGDSVQKGPVREVALGPEVNSLPGQEPVGHCQRLG